MTVEERIGAADRRKMDGNALFKEDKLEEAMQQYEMVAHLCSFCYLCIASYCSLVHLCSCAINFTVYSVGVQSHPCLFESLLFNNAWLVMCMLGHCVYGR